mmetsp:Transcript_20911/g.62319  ORF Transcript_20911/g.62319 Transcript_20911/m.62319 type:complete len:475 (-) Transcript_20911:52-1476(-)
MRAAIAWLTVAAANAQQASVARVPTQGSFGAELQARDQAYLDLSYVRTKKRKVLLHGTVDEQTQQALKTYGTTLKSDQLAAHSHNKFAIPITTDGTDPCPPNVTRHFTVKPWFWDNAWHFWNDLTALGHRLAEASHRHERLALDVFPDIPNDRIKLIDLILKPAFAGGIRGASTLFSSSETCLHLHWAVGPRVIGPVDGGGFSGERRAAADFWRHKLLEDGSIKDEDRDSDNYKPSVIFVGRSCAGRGAARCIRNDGLANLKKAFENRGWRVDANCCAWSDARKTLRSFAGADIVLGPHGAGLANALLARRGLVLVEVHGDFGAELDLFRKVADGRAGGYVSVKGRFSGLGGMRFTPEDASQIAACAVNVWLDGRNARVANATVTTSSGTLAACGRVGPDPSSPKLFVGSRKRLGSGGALIEGAAVVGHDVDCSSPGKPAPNKYVCPEAVDRTVQGRPGVPGPPQQPGRRRPPG